MWSFMWRIVPGNGWEGYLIVVSIIDVSWGRVGHDHEVIGLWYEIDRGDWHGDVWSWWVYCATVDAAKRLGREIWSHSC